MNGSTFYPGVNVAELDAVVAHKEFATSLAEVPFAKGLVRRAPDGRLSVKVLKHVGAAVAVLSWVHVADTVRYGHTAVELAGTIYVY